jgi:hypothetical protein
MFVKMDIQLERHVSEVGILCSVYWVGILNETNMKTYMYQNKTPIDLTNKLENI